MEKKWQKTGQQAGIVHKILKIPESLLKKLVKFMLIGPPGGETTGRARAGSVRVAQRVVRDDTGARGSHRRDAAPGLGIALAVGAGAAAALEQLFLLAAAVVPIRSAGGALLRSVGGALDTGVTAAAVGTGLLQ